MINRALNDLLSLTRFEQVRNRYKNTVSTAVQYRNKPYIHGMEDIIKTLRKAKCITQEQLYKATGISTDRLTGIQGGTGKLSLTELKALLAAIDATALIVPNTVLESCKTRTKA